MTSFHLNSKNHHVRLLDSRLIQRMTHGITLLQRSRIMLISVLMLSTLLFASPALANSERSAILPDSCVDVSMGAFPWSKATSSTAHDSWWEVLRDENH